MRSGRSLLLSSLAALAAACGGKSGGGAPASFNLSVTVSGGGSVTGTPATASCASGTCSSAQPSGTQVTLTASPRSGWTFGGWGGACSGTGTCSLTLDTSRAVTATFTATVPPGANVLPLSVNGTACGSGAGAYVNKPCVQVTVCLPGTSTCQPVDDVLLDTGSYGLRVFKQALPFSLPLAPSGSGTLAECIQYLDGSSHWGPVATADVVLGSEPTIQVPVQVIDSTFGPAPASCPKPETSPTSAGFKGILGVGPFAEDCGAGCVVSTAPGIYFRCSGGACSGTTVPLASQVSNPVASLPTDNNGVVVDLPAVQLGGQLTVEGSLLLGIDTQANNASTGATAYPGDPSTGDIRTVFDGKPAVGGFLDTGSNGLFFAAPSSGALPTCSGGSWYCPAQTTSLSATNSGTGGSPSGTVSFSIGNANSLFGSGNGVFQELGGPMPQGAGFDFGLPFFLGQKVFVGIEGKPSTGLGTAGPYYAY
jgi:hypothetical protein